MIYRGTVVRVTAAGVYVTIPDIGVGQSIGPCDALKDVGAATPRFVVDERVLCTDVGGIMDDIVILGKLYVPTTVVS